MYLVDRRIRCSRSQQVCAIMVAAVLFAAISTVSSTNNNNNDNSNQDVVAFTISKEETGVQKVMATLGNGGEVACEFNYKTSTAKKIIQNDSNKKKEEATKTEKDANKTPEVTAASVISNLNGRCASSDKGFWSYEVCIGKHIMQRHSQEKYLMGARVAPSSNSNSKSQEYVDGDTCKGVTGEPKRKTTVCLSP